MAQKFYMEFNFTVSGRTVKLKSINRMEIYYIHCEIKNEIGLPKYYNPVNFSSKQFRGKP